MSSSPIPLSYHPPLPPRGAQNPGGRGADVTFRLQLNIHVSPPPLPPEPPPSWWRKLVALAIKAAGFLL